MGKMQVLQGREHGVGRPGALPPQIPVVLSEPQEAWPWENCLPRMPPYQ